MGLQTNLSRQVLTDFMIQLEKGDSILVDRCQVVAHATLSALMHHWSSRLMMGDRELLKSTQIIREREPNRWMTQRRIAIAKLAMEFSLTDSLPPLPKPLHD